MTTGVGGSSIEAELASLGRWPDSAPAITQAKRLARQAWFTRPSPSIDAPLGP